MFLSLMANGIFGGNSTSFIGNIAGLVGGAILIDDMANLSISSSLVVSGNVAGTRGSFVYLPLSFAGTLEIGHSNTAPIEKDQVIFVEKDNPRLRAIPFQTSSLGYQIDLKFNAARLNLQNAWDARIIISRPGSGARNPMILILSLFHENGVPIELNGRTEIYSDDGFTEISPAISINRTSYRSFPEYYYYSSNLQFRIDVIDVRSGRSTLSHPSGAFSRVMEVESYLCDPLSPSLLYVPSLDSCLILDDFDTWAKIIVLVVSVVGFIYILCMLLYLLYYRKSRFIRRDSVTFLFFIGSGSFINFIAIFIELTYNSAVCDGAKRLENMAFFIVIFAMFFKISRIKTLTQMVIRLETVSKQSLRALERRLLLAYFLILGPTIVFIIYFEMYNLKEFITDSNSSRFQYRCDVTSLGAGVAYLKLLILVALGFYSTSVLDTPSNFHQKNVLNLSLYVWIFVYGLLSLIHDNASEMDRTAAYILNGITMIAPYLLTVHLLIGRNISLAQESLVRERARAAGQSSIPNITSSNKTKASRSVVLRNPHIRTGASLKQNIPTTDSVTARGTTNQLERLIYIPGYLILDLEQDFELGKKIGTGGTSDIFLAKVMNQELVSKYGQSEGAVKIVKGSIDKKDFLFEVALMG